MSDVGLPSSLAAFDAHRTSVPGGGAGKMATEAERKGWSEGGLVGSQHEGGLVGSQLPPAKSIHMRIRTARGLAPLHPTPFTLHPTPYTLHPTPQTLHPRPYTPDPRP